MIRGLTAYVVLATGLGTMPTLASRGAAIARDGKAVALNLPEIGRIIVSPFRAFVSGQMRCRVEIAAAGVVQSVETIGSGAFETETCIGLRAVGRVPAPVGMHRLGMIYHAASPNADVVEPLVVARIGRNGRWHVDEALSQRLSESDGTDTIGGIRAILARKDW